MTDTDIKHRLAERWRSRSPRAIANRLAAPLFGEAGNWDLPADVTPKRDLLYLAVGIPDAASLPREALRDATVKVFDAPGDAALRYGFGLGPTGLRQWLADERNRAEPCQVNEDWFQLTNGSFGAIDLVVRSMIDPGDIIIAEDPTYMGTLHNFRGVGADIRFVPMDEDGIDTTALARLLDEIGREGKRAKLIYTISAYHNPTGRTLSIARRHELLELAYEHDTVILDDEAYRELWYDAPPPTALSALADGHGVITVGTFSKTVATGLRVGWIHARPELLDLFGKMRFAMGQNGPGIRGVQAFVADGHYGPHVESMRQLYRAKRDRLDAAMRREVSDYMSWSVPRGGFYLWATLAPGLDLNALWRTAVHEGVAVNPGTGFSPRPDRPSRCIRIAYAWTPIDQLDEAARRLRLACERVAAGDVA